MNRFQYAFGLLILAQAAHSFEEYAGGLWESFPPARLLTGLFSENRERAFIALNVALVAFGLWCFIWPVRRGWPSAALFAWIWVAVELINGIVHPLWALSVGGYAPGVATAPMLLILAIWVLRESRRSSFTATTVAPVVRKK